MPKHSKRFTELNSQVDALRRFFSFEHAHQFIEIRAGMVEK